MVHVLQAPQWHRAFGVTGALVLCYGHGKFRVRVRIRVRIGYGLGL